MKNKLISVDFHSAFGFLKKPDINEDIYLTYNCLHKPALLGILGAIVGLGGYSQAYEKNRNELPEYFKELKDLKIGIQPIETKNGNFQKTVIVYNNSVGYASKEEGGNLIIKEQTLIKPKYRIYILLDIDIALESALYNNFINQESVFIPYLGKNDFQLYWYPCSEYEWKKFEYKSSFKISSIFQKEKTIKEVREKTRRIISPVKSQEEFFSSFERLPIGFSSFTKNYELSEFTFTNYIFPLDYLVYDLYELSNEQNKIIIQLF